MDTCPWDETAIRETMLNGDVTTHFTIELPLRLFQSYRRHHGRYLFHTHTHSPGAAQNPQSAIIYWFTTHRRPLVTQWVSLSVVCSRGESSIKWHFAQCWLFGCFVGFKMVLKCHTVHSQRISFKKYWDLKGWQMAPVWTVVCLRALHVCKCAFQCDGAVAPGVTWWRDLYIIPPGGVCNTSWWRVYYIMPPATLHLLTSDFVAISTLLAMFLSWGDRARRHNWENLTIILDCY